MADSWKVHALPLQPHALNEPQRYVVVLEQPDPRGFGWRRQIRGFAETGVETEGLAAEEARAIARALNGGSPVSRRSARASRTDLATSDGGPASHAPALPADTVGEHQVHV